MTADIDPLIFECDDGGGDPLPTVGEELRDMWRCFRRRAHGPHHLGRAPGSRTRSATHGRRHHRRPGAAPRPAGGV